MSFGYAVINPAGLNSTSQIRRAVDMVYQRGGQYDVVLTGTTYQDSMELVVDMYSDDVKVGQMSIVPYDTSLSGSTYYYKFGIRPYDYMSNYIESEHYTQFMYSTGGTTNRFDSFNLDVNVNRTNYRNKIKANFKYGYRYYTGTTLVTEYTGSTPSNNLEHAWHQLDCSWARSWQLDASSSNAAIVPNGYYFDYIGGALQMDEHLIMQNYDQEMGTYIDLSNSTGNFVLSTGDYETNYSPAAQFIFDYPRTPYQSEKSRFLTDAPRIQYVTDDDNYCLSYLQGQTGDKDVIEAFYARIVIYDVNNTRLQITYQTLIKSGSTFGNYVAPTGFTDTLSIWTLPCGPADLNNVWSFNINAAPYNTWAYYTIQICGGYPTDNAKRNTNFVAYPISEKFYFYRKDNCLPEDTRVVWLNNRGGYDYYTFTAYRQDTKKISRQTYDNRQYQTNPNSPDRAVGRTIKTFATDIEQEIVLESDFLNLPTGNWIEQLFYSPQVYIMKADYTPQIGPSSDTYKRVLFKDLSPVQIISTEVDTITKKHQKLNKYRISMKVANNFFVNKGF